MNGLETVLSGSVDLGRVPFLIGATAYFDLSQWIGCTAIPSVPEISLNSVLRIVSMSKAVGITAAPILEERGLLDWRVPVEGNRSVLVRVWCACSNDHSRPSRITSHT